MIGHTELNQINLKAIYKVFIWFVSVLFLFYSGHLYSNDSLTKIHSANNFISSGSFAINPTTEIWGIQGRNGQIYPHFLFGSIVNLIPPILVYKGICFVSGKVYPHYILSACITTANLIYTACIGVLIFILLRHFGKSKKESFLFANIMIFCTELLPYSSTGWSEPSALMWGLLGFIVLFTCPYKKSQQSTLKQWSFWALCCSITVLIRIEYIAYLIIFLGINLAIHKKEWKKYSIALLIISLAMVSHLLFNYYRFSTVFNFGYFKLPINSLLDVPLAKNAPSPEGLFQIYNLNNYIKTFYRTYISFGRLHWFWVAPLLLLAPLTFIFRKSLPPLICHAFFAACAYLLILPIIGSNSWCWANRYLYTIFPFLLLPIFFFPLKIKEIRVSFVFLSIMGLIISVLGSLVNYHYALELLVDKYGFNGAMWQYTGKIHQVPFWTHVSLFPKQIYDTLQLIINSNNLPSWETLRVMCLDIWPVGLCGAGIHPFISFGLWFISILFSIFFGLTVMKSELLKY